MTNLEMEFLHSLLVKYIHEAKENGIIDTFNNSEPEKSDEIIKTVERAECFICSFMPVRKD
jgi:hypothetical protein